MSPEDSPTQPTAEDDLLDSTDKDLYLAAEQLRDSAQVVGISLDPGLPRVGALILAPVSARTAIVLGNLIVDAAAGAQDTLAETATTDVGAHGAAAWLHAAFALAGLPLKAGRPVGTGPERRIPLSALDRAGIQALARPIDERAAALTTIADDLKSALHQHGLLSVIPHAMGGRVETGWMSLPDATRLLRVLGGTIHQADTLDAHDLASATRHWLADLLQTLLNSPISTDTRGPWLNAGDEPAITIGPLSPSSARALTGYLSEATA